MAFGWLTLRVFSWKKFFRFLVGCVLARNFLICKIITLIVKIEINIFVTLSRKVRWVQFCFPGELVFSLLWFCKVFMQRLVCGRFEEDSVLLKLPKFKTRIKSFNQSHSQNRTPFRPTKNWVKNYCFDNADYKIFTHSLKHFH